MAESEEALQLKRRARRRVVGAIALVTFVVIILPLVLDKEPGPAGPSLEVQIPSQESGGFTTRVVPPGVPRMPAAPATEKTAPALKADTSPATSAPSPDKVQSSAAKVESSAAKVEPSPAKAELSPARVAPSPAKPAPADAHQSAGTQSPPVEKTQPAHAGAAPSGQTWAVRLEAFSNAKNVQHLRARLSAAGVKSYTEAVKTSKGELTRVRAGPFSSREAADKARAKLEAMGLKPGAVASR